MEELIHILEHAVMITGFVFIMMLVIEYVNVQTNGFWERHFKRNKWEQYLFAALLGVIPGCLGSFTMVALFSHRLVSFGALVTTMIATSGDEAFVMFARIPKQAFLISAIVLVVGIIAGVLTDKFFKVPSIYKKFEDFKFHIHQQEHCECFGFQRIKKELRNMTMQRFLLIILVSIILVGSLTGTIGPNVWDWVRVTLLITSTIAMFIVLTVPEHFLEEHLWNHIVKKHIPRIFLWTLGTLLAVHFLMLFVDIDTWVQHNIWLVMLIALIVGIIPESGPHMIFITLYISGSIPFSILLANSIVQDGHGMLPLFAESKRAFIGVKLVNVAVGLVVGAVGVLFGF